MDVQEYLVTLGIRPAELSGLKELPGSTKDRLTPPGNRSGTRGARLDTSALLDLYAVEEPRQ